ncbi:MAG TPA: hypothetical protein VJO32_18125 [Ktedonobacteraceae bacterium]|nr:hypothetical protein [Ktedonobacteraceae bacterium]
MCGVAAAHPDRSLQFASVIPVARSAKRAEELMGMCLKHNSTGANDFSSLPSGVAWRADLIKSAMRSRQRIRLRQRALTSSLSGPINIDHDPLPTGSVKQAKWRGKRRSCKQILLKDRAERFYCWLIQCRQKTGQSRAMRQPVSAKQGHERRGPWSEPFVKGQQRRFTRHYITD